MAPRAEGLTFEAAQEHWRTAHGDVASGIPGLRGYVQNHAVLRDGLPLLPYPGFDACSELEFADFDAMR
ncbi:MAG: EthD domain-containing protein, partial [Solirubrobacteraceae bacterium]